MNSFRNSKFFRAGFNLKDRNTPKTILFSGFLVAFLGTSGMSAGLSTGMATITDKVDRENEAVEQSACPSRPTTLDSLQIAEDYSKDKKEPVLSEECLKEKNIEGILVEEAAVPKNTDTEIAAVLDHKLREQVEYENKVSQLETMLKGYPLAKMAPAIAKQEPEIAGLIVGIARKESQWGVHSPKKNGDCYNYWGYKGVGERGVGMGYACFAEPEEAIEKISERLEKLVQKKGTSKPSALVTSWKCGSSCATHSPESVSKWVSDVNQYYTKVLALK